MSIFDFLRLPVLKEAVVVAEPHEQDTSILQRVTAHTTVPAPAGASIPPATDEEIDVTRPDPQVLQKAKGAAKRKASTSADAPTEGAKKTRVRKERAGARSSGQIAEGEYELAIDDGGDVDHDIAADDLDDVIEQSGRVSPGREVPATFSAEVSGVREVSTRASSHVSHGTTDDTHLSAGTAAQMPSTGLADPDAHVVMDDHTDIGGDDHQNGVSHHDDLVFGDDDVEDDTALPDSVVHGEATAGEFHRGGCSSQAEACRLSYPYDEDAVPIPQYTREEWEKRHIVDFGIYSDEVFQDPKVCRSMRDNFPTAAENYRTSQLSSRRLVEQMSVLQCQMMSHGNELSNRYMVTDRNYRQLLTKHKYLESVLSERADSLRHQTQLTKRAEESAKGMSQGLADQEKKLKRYRSERDALRAEVRDLKGKLVTTRSQHAAKVKDLDHMLTIRDNDILSKNDTIADMDVRLRSVQDGVTSFFQSSFEPLVRGFLGSSEFNQEFARVLDLAVSTGLERGLRMGRSEEEFKEISQRVERFIPDANAQFAAASESFPGCRFPFFGKVRRSADATLSEIAHIRPDPVDPPSQSPAAPAPPTFGHTVSYRQKKKSSRPGSSSAV